MGAQLLLAIVNIVLTSRGYFVHWKFSLQTVPNERISFLRKNSDLHYLTKWREGLSHEVL